MKINLEQIFKELRDEKNIAAERQREFYFTGKLANYEKIIEKE